MSLRRATDAPLDHIYGPSFRREAVGAPEDVVVIDAGISSTQLAVSLAEGEPKRRITILSRHFLRQAEVDSDPGWLGPLYLTDFDSEPSVVERRAILDEARQPGSLESESTRPLRDSPRTA
ncbi:MAG: hypothetical protein AAF726_13150 [Planctomycetota bacterium]